MKRVFVFILSILMFFNFSLSAFATGTTIVKENEDVVVSKTVTTQEDQKKLEKLPVEIKAKSAVLMEVTSGEILM